MDRIALRGGEDGGAAPAWAAAPSSLRRPCSDAPCGSRDPWIAVAFTALSCFAAQSTQPLWWSCAIGISGRHVGALFGLMNAVGVFGAMSSQFLVGALADWMGARGSSGRDQWDPIFYIDAGVLLCAGVAWVTFRFVPVDRLDPSTPRPGTESTAQPRDTTSGSA